MRGAVKLCVRTGSVLWCGCVVCGEDAHREVNANIGTRANSEPTSASPTLKPRPLPMLYAIAAEPSPKSSWPRAHRYEGSNGVGWNIPTFPRAAPALLGFDESIDATCHGTPDNHAAPCIQSSNNILSLHGQNVPYNICRNLEWQTCAAKGLLPGQGGRTIRFAYEPRQLIPNGGFNTLGQCQGWVPSRGGGFGYATADIFYLEVCMFNQICSNGAEMFRLRALQDWHCDFSQKGFDALEKLLLSEWEEPADAVRC